MCPSSTQALVAGVSLYVSSCVTDLLTSVYCVLGHSSSTRSHLTDSSLSVTSSRTQVSLVSSLDVSLCPACRCHWCSPCRCHWCSPWRCPSFPPWICHKIPPRRSPWCPPSHVTDPLPVSHFLQDAGVPGVLPRGVPHVIPAALPL